MEIYYFSGTGNSLHVARELAKRFPDSSLTPIVSVLKNEKIETNADPIGLVFPIHAFTFPWPVKRFLEKATLEPTSYKFAIATRECFARVFSSMDRLLGERNGKLNACFSFEMPQTYVPLFDVYPQEERARTEAEMREHLACIEKIVASRETFRPEDPPGWFLFSHIVYPLVTAWFREIRFPDMEKSFHADHRCTGCGTCEKVCLSQRIRLENERPVWQDGVRCMYCFACLHYCPSEAVQIEGRSTMKRGRYHHPAITVKDIADQKTFEPRRRPTQGAADAP